MLYPMLDCECKHPHAEHHDDANGSQCKLCSCTAYDPAGHNPEIYNILCPRCRKVRLEKAHARTYACPVCTYIMFEKQVKEALGETIQRRPS